MTEQTWGINNEIADFDMRNWYCKLPYNSPVAKNRNVHAISLPRLKVFADRCVSFEALVSPNLTIPRRLLCSYVSRYDNFMHLQVSTLG